MQRIPADPDPDSGGAVAEWEARILDLEHQLLRERDRTMGMVARVAEVTAEAERQRRRAAEAEELLRQVTGSARYRVGMVLVSPGRVYKRWRETSS